MAKLKVPSALHLARLWRPDEVAVKKALIALTNSAPPFSYAQLMGMLRSMLAVKSDLGEMEYLISTRVRLGLARKSYLEIAPLLEQYFGNLNPTFVHEVSPRTYPLSRSLRVPFEPPMIYGARGKVHLPLFVFWRNNPLTGDQAALLASMIRELVSQDPDLDLASTSILDFSIPKGAAERALRETSLFEVPAISNSRRDEMLAIFAAGYELARNELQGRAASETEITKRAPSSDGDTDQQDLFPEW